MIIFAIILGSTALGLFLGRRLRHRSDVLREPFAVLHSALLGMMALVLAFGLALAMGRYQSRRVALVDETNAIGTTYLRAQTLSEPDPNLLSGPAEGLHRHEHRAVSFRAWKRR